MKRNSVTKNLITVLIMVLTLSFSMNVDAKVTKTKGTVKVGQSVTLTVYKCKKKVKWSSSNKKIAKVKSSGKTTATITGVKAGKATITGKVNGKKVVSAKVTVKKNTACKKHVYEIVSTELPTCTKEGKIKYRCKVCGNTYTEKIAKTDHEFVKKDVVAPTPTEDGYTRYVCENCGKEDKRDITKYVALTEEEIYSKIMSLQTSYPDGSKWDLNSTFTDYEGSGKLSNYLGSGACGGFAALVSVNTFGEFGLMYEYTDWSAIRVGDIIIYPSQAHASTVIEVNKERGYVRIVEGNNGGKVKWGDIVMPAFDGDNPLTYDEMKNPYTGKVAAPVQLSSGYIIYTRYQTPPTTANYITHDLNDYDE